MTLKKLTITEHNSTTGEYITRLMTDAEFEIYKADKAREDVEKAEAAIKAEAKIALLKKLGITEAEAELLLA